MNDGPDSLLRCAALSVAARHDPATPLVTGIDWDIRRGDCWIVGGQPGCGRSQLLETLAGLIPPHGGEVAGGDGAPAGLSTQRPRGGGVGLVFPEGGRPFHELTVAQNVALPLRYHENRTFEVVLPRVRRLLAWVGLEAWAETHPAGLPRGLRLRLALARALALGPELLLLDNPLSGLPASEARWWITALPRLLQPTEPDQPTVPALVVGTDDLRPWLGLGTAFALIHDARWQALGDRSAVIASTEPAVRTLLAGPEAAA